MKKTISLDSWQVKSFLTCEESFKLSFIENLRRFRVLPPEKRYTDKGTLVHSMLAIFYTLRALNPREDRLKHGTETIRLVKKNKLIQKAGFPKEFEDFIIERFQQYLFTYIKQDFIPVFNNGIVGIEVPFAVRLFEDEEKIFVLLGRIDLLGSFGTLPKIFVDHKTQERVGTLYERKIQFLCYALATGFEYGMINYFGLQKDLKEESLRQQLIHIPKTYTEYFKNYLILKFHEIYVATQSGYFERNLNSCSGPDEKRPCEFTPICTVNEKETQTLVKRQFYEVVKPWSPWNVIAGKDEEIVEL